MFSELFTVPTDMAIINTCREHNALQIGLETTTDTKFNDRVKNIVPCNQNFRTIIIILSSNQLIWLFVFFYFSKYQAYIVLLIYYYPAIQSYVIYIHTGISRLPA